MNKRRKRAITKARFYMEVHDNKKFWTTVFNNRGCHYN